MIFKKKRNNFKKRCELCELHIQYVDYKNVDFLNKYITGTGTIKPHLATGTCAKDQRKIAMAIKRARYMALMPYLKERVRVLTPTSKKETVKKEEK
ncbi:30S ribosomal protein [Mycoplasmopsis maculosa]|uniref:Small ribosomal subunit protein bS18 n=1 Tax=Mycoplasmopsis maculosa TaxID=114885 RepID=A0A449B5D1_9BACT|nr:30S ribosomal protein S18 [Mycoplasmopsis maculosa]VEU75779.1 30S ribosomal protein [Mycoplasmopsis maculosa]